MLSLLLSRNLSQIWKAFSASPSKLKYLGCAFGAVVAAAMYCRTHPKAAVNVAVITSRTAQGTSSFINFIRGVRDGDRGWAKTDFLGSTTEVCTSYEWNVSGIPVRLWDCPAFCDDNARNTLDLSHFDLVIIVATVWLLRDHWIVEKCQEMGTRFYIVRNKVDLAIHNHTEAVTSQIINDFHAKILPEYGIDGSRLYLFTSKVDQFDRYRHVFGPERDRFMDDFACDLKVLHNSLQVRPRFHLGERFQ